VNDLIKKDKTKIIAKLLKLPPLELPAKTFRDFSNFTTKSKKRRSLSPNPIIFPKRPFRPKANSILSKNLPSLNITF
jgi:hypothetical protein